MRYKSIAFTFLSFLSIQAMSQDYLVTIQRDTLKGDIDILMPEEFSESISITANGDKNRYKAFEILSAYIDSVHYKPVKLQSKYRLMKVVVDNYLSLLRFRPNQSYQFSSQYLLKKTLEGTEIPNISFRKKITEFLNECPEVVSKIEDKTYKKADLQKIVMAYNQCLEAKTEARYQDKEKENKEIKKETTALSKENQDIITRIDSVKNKLPEDNTELQTLLSDIKTKLTNNQPVPGYLIGALKAQTEGLTEIQDDVNELIVKIENSSND